MTSLDQNTTRQIFFDTWYKHIHHLPLEPIESLLINIILLHPEYHHLLDQPEEYQFTEFNENNPFLHLSLHLALREQLSINRPKGITAIYKTLCEEIQDSHLAEHKMIECLANLLCGAQKSGKKVEEHVYLEYLQKLIK
jgi:hypothetical protein